MHIIFAIPHGFCAGVTRALDTVEILLQKEGSPIYVKHEIVHNKLVVQDLESRGVVFIEDLAEVPDNSTLVYSAHGVSKDFINASQARKLQVVDATCPLVKKIHVETANIATLGKDCIFIGHANHPEIIGSMGHFPTHAKGKAYLVENVAQAETLTIAQPDNVNYVTQTTLSILDTQEIIKVLTRRYPNLQGPRKSDICYATENRQAALRAILPKVEVVLVLGDPSSSNTNRLLEIAKMSTTSYLITTVSDLHRIMFEAISVIGITAGASTPKYVIEQVTSTLRTFFPDCTTEEVVLAEENVTFNLPHQLIPVTSKHS